MPRRWVLSVALLSGAASAAPSGLRDGEIRSLERPVRLALVGSTRAVREPWRGEAVITAVTRADPTLTVLLGDAVPRGSCREWRLTLERWAGLGGDLFVVPGRGERRGDSHLARYRQMFPTAGVPDLNAPSFWHFDLVTGGVTWRFVVLDAGREGLGRRWQDQVYWVPKVVGGDDFDRLVVLLSTPVASLSLAARNDPESGAAALLAQVEDHVDPRKLGLIVFGGTRTNEVLLPGGPFGPATLVAGNGAVESAALAREGESSVAGYTRLRLAEAFDRALARRTSATGLAEEPPAVYPAEDGHAGWWLVTLDGTAVEVAFQFAGDDRPGFAMSLTPTHGWIAGPP